MGHPKKDRKDNVNPEKGKGAGENRPDSEAISPEIVFTQMDSYQKELEKQWDQAKESYQHKIDEIMDDFLKEKGLDPNASEAPAEKTPPSSAEKKSSVPPSTPQSKTPGKKKETEPERSFEDMVNDLKESLKDVSPEPRELVFKKTWAPSTFISKTPFDAGTVKKSFPWLISLICLGIAAAGIFWFLTVGRITPLPYSHGATLHVSENQIIIADWFRKSIFVHAKRRGLPITSVENLPNDFLSGLFYEGEIPHSLNGVTGELYVHAETEDHRVTRTLTMPGISMAGAWLDEAGFWTADNEGKKVFQLHPGDFQEIISTLRFPDGKIHSLQVHQNRLWALDRDSREIRVFRIEEPLRLLASFDLDPFLDGAKPTAHFLEGDTLWVVTENPSRLLKIRRSTLEKSLPTDF